MRENLENIWKQLRKLFLFVLLCWVFFAVIIMPLMIIMSRHTQAEALACLRDICTSQFAHYGEHGQWATSFKTLAWSPFGIPHYTFFMSPNDYAGKDPEELGLELPLDFGDFDTPIPGIYETGFIAVAIGDIDFDGSLDVWWIDEERTPTNSQDDSSYWQSLADWMDMLVLRHFR